jgi:hypothetical protein
MVVSLKAIAPLRASAVFVSLSLQSTVSADFVQGAFGKHGYLKHAHGLKP